MSFGRPLCGGGVGGYMGTTRIRDERAMWMDGRLDQARLPSGSGRTDGRRDGGIVKM